MAVVFKKSRLRIFVVPQCATGRMDTIAVHDGLQHSSDVELVSIPFTK